MYEFFLVVGLGLETKILWYFDSDVTLRMMVRASLSIQSTDNVTIGLELRILLLSVFRT